MADMFFGTLEKMQMVKCALSEWAANAVGNSSVLGYVNGGADVVAARAYSRQFELSWSGTPAEINVFKHYQQGYYGTGLLYLSDPITWHYNVVPPNWASPRLIEVGDWKNVYNTTPTFSNTATNSYNQPARTATWSITDAASTVPTQVLTLPIPPTQKLHVGFSGSVTGTGVVRARPIKLDGTYDTVTDLTPLSATASTRLNVSFSGATYKAVEVYLTRTSSATSTVSVTSLMAQLWNSNITPTLTGVNIPGEGFMGMKFSGPLSETYYQAAGVGLERKGISALLVEVEPWV